MKGLLCLGVRSKLSSGFALKSYNRFSEPKLGNVRYSSTLNRTCLHALHVSEKGKMTDFAGYSMPLVYGDQGHVQSHLHTRKSCSVFDVSHMLQTRIDGKHAVAFVEAITVADVQGLKDSQATLSVFTEEKGGILDDLIITRDTANSLFLVTNAGCRQSDMALLKGNLDSFKSKGLDVSMEHLEDRALVAVQGPKSAEILQPLLSKLDLKSLYFMHSRVTEIDGIPDCRISRCGYTGEDGFEISLPESSATSLVRRLMEQSAVKLAGLAARDSLRLEAGLCLYGNDIDTSTTPIEAGLAWTIGKRRRELGDFPGASVILGQLKSKPDRRRVGLRAPAGPAARAGAKVWDAAKEKVVGTVSSGCPSPTLNLNVAMGYVERHVKLDNPVWVEIRPGKMIEAHLVKMPFVKPHYYLPPN